MSTQMALMSQVASISGVSILFLFTRVGFRTMYISLVCISHGLLGWLGSLSVGWPDMIFIRLAWFALLVGCSERIRLVTATGLLKSNRKASTKGTCLFNKLWAFEIGWALGNQHAFLYGVFRVYHLRLRFSFLSCFCWAEHSWFTATLDEASVGIHMFLSFSRHRWFDRNCW